MTPLVNSILKILTLGVLLTASLLAVPPASANHYTTCTTVLYNPLSGDPAVERCSDYSGTYYSCYSRRDYYDSVINVYYQTYNYCDGNSWNCYSVLYVDTSPVRVGTC